MKTKPLIGGAAIVTTMLAAASWVSAQGQMHPGMDMGAKSDAPAPIRIKMETLHAQGGVPKGWRFLLPKGDATEGRKVFVSLECFACHEIKGETFPEQSKTPRGAGPELTGMGAHHPAEYFAESVIYPNRVIVLGEGYTGPDGLSKMPSYAETMTIQQLIDLVAYLKSLTSGGMMHGRMKMSPETTHGGMKMGGGK